MDGKLLAQIAAVAFVAIAVTATIVELTRKEERPETAPTRQTQTNAADPLRAELFRCQSLGEAGPRDPACLRAWAESRRRFLTPSTAISQGTSGSLRSGGESAGEGTAPNGE